MKRIGGGAYGTVYEIQTKYNKKHALKTYEARKFTTIGLNDLREVDISLRLRHPYVIQVLDYTSNYVIDNITAKYAVVYPLANGTLKYLQEKIESKGELIKYFLQLLLGLDYVHKRDIILLDIKPSNILYFEKEDAVKFADFGISVYDDIIFRKEVFGTITYAAPELMFELKEIYKSSDIWSLGMTFLESMIGWSPQTNLLIDIDEKHFNDRNEKIEYYNKQIERLIKEAFQEIKYKNVVDMLSKMLKINHNERATAEELIKLPLFDKYRKDYETIEKLYVGCPILLLYINTHDLSKYNNIYNILKFTFNNCDDIGDYWAWFNAVDIINYLMTINFFKDGNGEYISLAAFILSLKLYDSDYYEVSNIVKFIPHNFDIDYKILEEYEKDVFDKLYGKIYRKNIYSYIVNLNINVTVKTLSDYVLTTVFEGEMPDYVFRYLPRENTFISNPYANVLKF